ncbi:hypothetical protein [Nitrosomonas oligotropha]|uniref:hypothetical protein n=1 Tax=Nitrosomonas oligotropha TaxID=42354 RepID=UPI00136C9193|nr:hypothetical protein [Nitrosomonas oligotropha]MXS82766.1 hypothetical protein [Nitrosomonas oligotropha]
MPQPDDPHSLYVPLFDTLDAVGFGEYENPHHFNTGTLFWSLTRLFGCYERIMSVINLSREERPFLDADLENFIIWFRIVLNDIAYVTWQLLPKSARGLKGPRGGSHPQNREVSILSLAGYLIANTSTYPELSAAFSNAVPWMTRLRKDRDNVIHYKSKAVVFESDSPLFALLGAAGTEHTEPTPDGGQRLVLESVVEFVNGQMLTLHQFMHDSLATAIKAHVTRLGLKSVQVGWCHRITCFGINRFRQNNALVA